MISDDVCLRSGASAKSYEINLAMIRVSRADVLLLFNDDPVMAMLLNSCDRICRHEKPYARQARSFPLSSSTTPLIVKQQIGASSHTLPIHAKTSPDCATGTSSLEPESTSTERGCTVLEVENVKDSQARCVS
ncbi:hypothetical protein J1614_004702 [Plenodomus biglobosus]|nr:hypothetical protein J1614_004702 [Plenodomus biglobosus]